jgi:hypothetical protein
MSVQASCSHPLCQRVVAPLPTCTLPVRGWLLCVCVLGFLRARAATWLPGGPSALSKPCLAHTPPAPSPSEDEWFLPGNESDVVRIHAEKKTNKTTYTQ